jgi:hypothetical protein
MATVITQELSEALHDMHVALWTWLAQHPASQKIDWPGWACVPANPVLAELLHTTRQSTSCFACTASGMNCPNCPITWADGSTGHSCYNAEYGIWNDPKASARKRARFARVISRKPWTHPAPASDRKGTAQ